MAIYPGPYLESVSIAASDHPSSGYSHGGGVSPSASSSCPYPAVGDLPVGVIVPLSDGFDGEPVLRLALSVQDFVLVSGASSNSQKHEVAHALRLRLEKSFLIAWGKCKVESRIKVMGREV